MTLCRSLIKSLGEVSLPTLCRIPDVAYFGHIIGYGAGYYGYAWADAIAADMANGGVEDTPDGFFDKTAACGCGKRSIP